jgi:hypothetical protein
LKRRDEILRRAQEEKQMRLDKKYQKINQIQTEKDERQKEFQAYREQLERDRSLTNVNASIKLPSDFYSNSRNSNNQSIVSKSPYRGAATGAFSQLGRMSVAITDQVRNNISGVQSSRSFKVEGPKSVTPNKRVAT